MEVTDARLRARLLTLVPCGVAAAARIIRADDDKYLTRSESERMRKCVPRVRQASGAARALARELLVGTEERGPDIGRGSHGEPIWPKGVIGSLTHDNRIAAAVIGINCKWAGLGIDVESGEPPGELAGLIATAEELQEARAAGATLRQIFSIKEAVFKAAFPLDRAMLDFHDVKVSFQNASARTSCGREVNWNSYNGDYVFAVAWC
jgi:4'-phosphopantetheinyl transferase EntD